MSAKYMIGIDLGTTNSVIAYTRLDADAPQVELLPIPMLVDVGTVEARTSLPSFLHLPTPQELGGSAFDLPGREGQQFVVGELARSRAAESPDRTVAAAKSWLCHSRVDRRQAILPWNAPEEVGKVSPVVASQRYLQHLAAAWEQAMPEAPLADQQVVLTVPASFDAAARELTREAALGAGLPAEMLFLEEPQAAVYSWLTTMGDRWRKFLKLHETILVCDIGGGTTDFTLIRVAEQQGELQLQRVAVGDHLLVGGDNMDLSLAHLVAEQFRAKNVQLDPWQSVALWHSCRTAKEALLAADGPSSHPISVLGRGSKLIGGTVTVKVERAEVAQFLLEGFMPQCKATDKPARPRASGFQEIGLPFESDPAVTRHLSSFLQAHQGQQEHPVYPTHVLFNGGVFKSSALKERLLEVMQSWSRGAEPTSPLPSADDLDHAVALGAAYYGWAKEKGGVRIRGGVARSYYVGIETAGLAIPGAPRPLKALCVVPFGMEEGTELDVPSAEIGLVLGEPTQFRFFSSPTRKQDRPGDLLDAWNTDELVETDPLEATLPADESVEDSYVPVHFHSQITELGMFELWCVAARQEGRWKLEFSVRDENEG